MPNYTMDDAYDPTEVGRYKEQICALCDRPITHQDALVSGGGVQCMDFGARAHRGCYQKRYKPWQMPRPREEQAVMEMEEVEV